MKSKFKRISKSTMSVILSLCMIMSCMTVGLIATDAAKVTGNEAVGSGGDPVDRIVYMRQDAISSTAIYDEYKVLYKHNSSDPDHFATMTNTGRTQNGYPVYQATIQDWWDGLTTIKFQGFNNGSYVKEATAVSSWQGTNTYNNKIFASSWSTLNYDTVSAPQIFGAVDTSSWNSSLKSMTDEGNGIYSYSGANVNADVLYRIKYDGYYYKYGNSDGVVSTDSSAPTLAVVHGTSDASSGAFKYSPGGDNYTIYFNSHTIQTWVETNPVTPAATDVTLTASPSVVESGVSTDITLTASATPAAGATLQYTFYKGSTPLGAAQSGNTFTATAQTLTADTTYKVVVSDSTPATELGDVEATATVSLAHDIYIYGTQFGGWDWNASTPSSTIKKMTYVPSVDAYYYDATIDNPNNNNNPDNNRFRFWDDTDSDTHYHPSSNTQLAVGGAHASASSGSSNYFYTQGVTGDLRFWFSLSNKEAWVENQFDPLNEGFYSLSGNVTDKYIVGSEIVKPKNVDTGTWWSTYHEELAIDDVVDSAGSGKFKIVFTTTDYAGGINIGLAGKDDVQYAYYYNSTAYNTSLSGGDLDLTTSEMQSAGYIDNVYVYDVDSTNPGGSLKLMPNTTYTITIDQTARLNNSDSNPLGKMKIEWNKVYANAVAMTSTFDKNNRRYNAPEENTTGGTATASPADGNKNELDPTFTATPNSGYTFAGWYSDPECTELVSADATYNETNIPVEHTYYALFKQDKPTTEHTVTVTINSAGDYGTITPGPGLEYVDIDESTPGSTVITFKAYDGATTYIDAVPNEPTDSAIYELGTVTFSPSGSGTESNGRINLPNISGNIGVTVPFTTRSTYTVTLTGTHGKISAQAKNPDGTNYTGSGNSVSNVYSSTVNVPIGGKVTLTAGTNDSNYEFSNFNLETGKYKRTSDQNTSTSPMTIRPLEDMTAEAVFVQPVSSNWKVRFTTGNSNNDQSMNKYTGLYVSGINDGSDYESKDVYKLKFTTSRKEWFYLIVDGTEYKFESSGQVSYTDTEWPKTSSYNGNATNEKTINDSGASSQTYYFYAVVNKSGEELKLRVSTTDLGGGSSIDTSSYRKIYAMDGVEAKTASYGDTVIINPIGLLESDIEDAEGNSEAYVETHTNHNTYFYDPDFEGEITFRVQTTINNHGTNQSNSALGVRGFVYNGKSVEATNKGNGVYYADITIKASDIVDINGRNDVLNDGKYPILEIVPVYYNEKLKDSTDCIKFYVDANSLQNKFGFNLGYYAWYSDNTKHEVDMSYPGQPLLKEGTKYYTYIPKKYTANNASSMGSKTFAGVLLDNLAEHCDVHKEVLKSWGCVTNNDQTFDYEDPARITELGANIIEFVVKYEETNANHQTGTHWYNSQYSKEEFLNGKTASNYSHTIPITKPVGKSRLNGFEQLRNFDNDPVDIYENKLTPAQNNFDDAIFIVSVGNQDVSPNDWDTVWMVYDHNGNFVEAANPAAYIEKASQSNALKNKPVYINYEKFLDGSDNHQTHSHGGDTGNSGDRIDGRWLYSRNSDPSNAHIRVATLGKNGDTMNFMTYAAGASGARIAYDDDSCDGITQVNANNPNTPSTQEDFYGRWTTFPNRETKAKAVLNQPNGYKIVGFYMQKVGTLGDEDDNYFSNSLADYDEMDRESATVAKFTNSRNNYIVAVVEKVPSSNLHLSHEMYGGVGAHNGAGQFYIKAEVLGPKSGSNRPVIASSGGFVNGSDGYEFEYLNGIARKVSSANEDDHYMVRVTLRTVMAGSNTLYQWYSKDPADASYVEIPDNSPASYGKSGTQEKVILVDVNTLYGDKTDTFTYTNLDYYSDIEIPGSIYFKHLKTDTCEGDGDLTAQVKVYKKESNDTYALMDTFNSVNGVVEIPSAKTLQYFNSGDDYYIDSTFTAAPDSSSTYVNTYKNAAGTTEVSPDPTRTEGVGSVSPKVYPFDNPNANRIPLSSFFTNSGTEQEPAWSFDTTHNTFVFYSKFDRLPEYTANVAIQYFNSSEDTTPDNDTLTTVTSGSDQKKQGSTTTAKVYFDNDPTTTSSTALQGGTFATPAKDDPNPANGYDFIGWYIYDSNVAGNDKYRPVVPADYTANANKTFVARYRKADETGSVTIDHNLISSAPENCGTPTLSVEVYNDAGTKVATYPASGSSNSVTIDETYIKYDTTNKYKLRVILNTNVNSGFRFDDFYKTDSTANAIGSDDYQSRNVSTNPATVTIKDIDVNSTFFQTESDGSITFISSATPIHYFSNIIKQYTATVKIQYMDDNFDNSYTYEDSYISNTQGQVTGAKVYYTSDNNTRVKTFDSGATIDYTKNDNGSSYTFVGWYYYDETSGSYKEIIESGTPNANQILKSVAEVANKDKTFVARYHKNAVTGSITVSHNLFPGSESTGTVYNSVSYVDGEGHETEITANANTSDSSVGTAYIKGSDSNGKIKIVIRTTEASTYHFEEFRHANDYANIGTATDSNTSVLTDSNAVPKVTVGDKTATIEFPVSYFFTTLGRTKTFNTDKAYIKFFSKLSANPTYSINITKDIDNDNHLANELQNRESSFPIRIQFWNGSSFVDYEGTSISGTDYKGNTVERSRELYGDIKVFKIHQGDNLTISGLQSGTQIRIFELDNVNLVPAEGRSSFASDFNSALNNYYYSATEVKNVGENTDIGTALSGLNGKSFTIGSSNVNYKITNKAILYTLTVTKAFSDFTYTDHSKFNLQVTYKPTGADTSNYVANQSGTAVDASTAENISDPTKSYGEYRVEKSGQITFANIPKGTQFNVVEPDGTIGISDVTGEKRFVFDTMTLSTSAAFDSTQTNGRYFTIKGNDDASGHTGTLGLTVYNKVKKNWVKIQKDIDGAPDTVAEHTIKVKIKENGNKSDSTWLTAIQYRNVKDRDAAAINATMNANNEAVFTIKQGAPLYFYYPVGSVFSIEEITPGDNGYELKNFVIENVALSSSLSAEAISLEVTIPDPTAATVNPCVFQTKDAVASVTITNKLATLNKYEFTYKYKSRHKNSNSTDDSDRVYGDQTFTSKGEITAEELAEYFEVNGSTSFKFKDDVIVDGKVTKSYKQEFIAAKSPYEKNFKEKITWRFSAATVNVVYDSTNKYWTVKTAADVTADYDYDPKLSAEFDLPYEYYDPTTTTSIVPGENDGVIPKTVQATIGGKTTNIVRKIDLEEIQAINISKTAADTDIKRARFLKWVTLNEIKSLEDLNNARATNPNAKALFIKAPESIYDDQNNEYVFRYWSMKSMEDEIEYAKCYSNEFNMALYQSSIIEPIYELKTGGNASQLEENAAFDTNNKMATIAFLENSRMQWNENGGGSKISDDLKQYSGDKLVTDFALAFDYQGLELRSKSNYVFGVVVEKLEGAIDPNNVPTNAELTEQHKNDNLTTAKNDVQAELVSKIYDNMVEGNKINKSYFSSDNANKYQISSSPTKNTLDNKNELEYYFAMDKFTNSYVDENNHSEGITSTETGLHLNKYRAFSFLMVPCKTPDSETVELKAGTELYVKFIISDPVYFTNYTEASISNGATN